jgi:hypothetical protein
MSEFGSDYGEYGEDYDDGEGDIPDELEFDEEFGKGFSIERNPSIKDFKPKKSDKWKNIPLKIDLGRRHSFSTISILRKVRIRNKIFLFFARPDDRSFTTEFIRKSWLDPVGTLDQWWDNQIIIEFSDNWYREERVTLDEEIYNYRKSKKEIKTLKNKGKKKNQRKNKGPRVQPICVETNEIQLNGVIPFLSVKGDEDSNKGISLDKNNEPKFESLTMETFAARLNESTAEFLDRLGLEGEPREYARRIMEEDF